jgi:hypothetical protein
MGFSQLVKGESGFWLKSIESSPSVICWGISNRKPHLLQNITLFCGETVVVMKLSLQLS